MIAREIVSIMVNVEQYLKRQGVGRRSLTGDVYYESVCVSK